MKNQWTASYPASLRPEHLSAMSKIEKIEGLIRDGALLINDGYRAKNSELSQTGLPFARAGNIDGGYHFEDADRVPADTLARVGSKRSRPGDVVFTSKGTVGRFAFVREDTPEFVYSPQLCFWRSGDKTRIHPRWLYYWMNGQEFYRQFKGVASQTDMAEYVSLRDQRAMQMTLPSLSEQKAIARILGTLDDKIENNRKLNHHLPRSHPRLIAPRSRAWAKVCPARPRECGIGRRLL